jgi:hypothetical protein
MRIQIINLDKMKENSNEFESLNLYLLFKDQYRESLKDSILAHIIFP